MESFVRERFNQKIFWEIISRFAIQPATIKKIDDFENFIYEFERNDDPYILRITHSSRRSKALIRGEVDWINYLYLKGINVAKSVHSRNGEFVELIEDGHGEQFLATIFIKAPGRPPWESGWSDETFRDFGRLIGRMHQLTQDYKPSDPGCQRPRWEDPIIQDVEYNLPLPEKVIREKYRKHFAVACSLPKEPNSYGLIHFDANPSNLLIDDEGTITLIDFDDCCYSWFINDIAIILFYMVMGQEDVTGFFQHFMENFLKGYRRENQLDVKWLVEIPHFLKLREIDMYALILRDFGVDTDDPWCKRFLQGRKQRIEKDFPYTDFDFTSLSKYL